jgi:hypothetical protein
MAARDFGQVTAGLTGQYWLKTCVCPSRRFGATHDLSLEIRLGQVDLVESIDENLVRAVLEA